MLLIAIWFEHACRVRDNIFFVTDEMSKMSGNLSEGDTPDSCSPPIVIASASVAARNPLLHAAGNPPTAVTVDGNLLAPGSEQILSVWEESVTSVGAGTKLISANGVFKAVLHENGDLRVWTIDDKYEIWRKGLTAARECADLPCPMIIFDTTTLRVG